MFARISILCVQEEHMHMFAFVGLKREARVYASVAPRQMLSTDLHCSCVHVVCELSPNGRTV